MGIGFNLLSSAGNNVVETIKHNIHIQLDEPSVTEGLWVKADISPITIESVLEQELKPIFNSWSTITLPTGYTSFAIVEDYIYLIGNTNGTYAKAYLKDTSFYWTYQSANSSLLFTNTTVIGTIIYATCDGTSMKVYQMDTNDSSPCFQLILPEVTSYNNPRICSYGTKLYSLKGGTGTQTAMVIDTGDSTPQWTALASLIEDSSKSSIIVHKDILYVIGIMSNGYKCYGLDLRSSSNTFQIVTSFVSQGTYYASLSTVGDILRIINCGFATNDRNTLSLINGIWQKALQTGLTQLTINSASKCNAYHTEYALYIKDMFNDNMYILGIDKPTLNLNDNTLLIVKGEGSDKTLTGAVSNYNIQENITSCYLLNIINDEEALTKLSIARYNGVEWVGIN